MTETSAPPSRRIILAALAAAPALAPLAARAAAGEGALYAYVGSYTPHGGGIEAYRVSPQTGALAPLAVTGGIANATWLVVDAPRRRLFALSEVGDYGPRKTGSVSSYAIGADGSLSKISTASSGASGPAHLSLAPSGRFVFAANYSGSALAVLPVAADGRLGEPQQVIAPPAKPPLADTHAGGNFAISDHSRPHMHMSGLDPSGRWLVAADAGSDRLYVWRFDAANGRLTPAAAPFAEAPAGSAPRHFAFHPSGRLLYVLEEHAGRLGTWSFDPATGALKLLESVSVLPAGFAGSNLSSELAFSPDQRFLYAGNRLRNSIMSFAVDPSGRLTRVAETWVEADYPRSFGFTPDGRWLYACCQNSDNLTTFRVDPASGGLAFTGAFTPVGSPASIVFFQA